MVPKTISCSCPFNGADECMESLPDSLGPLLQAPLITDSEPEPNPPGIRQSPPPLSPPSAPHSMKGLVEKRTLSQIYI